MCEIHAAWPTDKITLYVEGGEEPLAVEQPFANDEVVKDDDVHKMHEEGSVDAEGGGGEDFDWLEKGFEGPDFDDDIFGNVDDGSSTHDGVSGNIAAPHRPFEGDNVNATPHRPSEGDTPTNNDPPLEDNMESIVEFDDDQRAPTVAKEPKFNVQTDMKKLVLKKGMKFPNYKVFREALREYAINKPVDIKFRLNEKKKISVYCINECVMHLNYLAS